jgi:RecB family exonuclease
LTLRRGAACGLRAWTWGDLWAAIRADAASGPFLVSTVQQLAVLDEALARARRLNQLGPLGELHGMAGLRRHLLGRFAAWTAAGRDPDGDAPPGSSEHEVAFRAIYGHYRYLLESLGARDKAGFASWAAGRFRDAPGGAVGQLDGVVVIDPPSEDRAVLVALDAFHRHARSVLVALPWDEAQPYAYPANGPLRDHLLGWGFRATRIEPPSTRPAGLTGLERMIFRDDRRESLSAAGGLAEIGAPRGEGLGLAVARRVRELLDAGARPDDVLVLLPAWNEQAELVVGTIKGWGIPVHGAGGVPLARHPAIAALLLAMSLPERRWDARRLIRLLRNGRLRPPWLGEVAITPAAAARAVHESRCFRDLTALRSALGRLAEPASTRITPRPEDQQRDEQRARRAGHALEILDRLSALLDPSDAPATWDAQCRRIPAIVDGLGLVDAGECVVEALLHALDDWAAIVERLGRGQESWTWEAFVRRVRSLAREVSVIPEEAPIAAVRVTTVAEVEGLQADHVILADLDEGTFPSREALASDPDEPDADEPARVPPAYAREMHRFLRSVGGARHSLTFAFSTTDEQGQALLPAGFLDEARRVFEPEVWAALSTTRTRLDPILPPELSVAPRDRRVGAVARAAAGSFDDLRDLARQADHAEILSATADALEVSALRSSRTRRYTAYEGRLHDRDTIGMIAGSLGRSRVPLSASQLESLAFCPFQFFQRYVARLQPGDDRDELEEDRAARGSLIHAALEELHVRLRDAPLDDTSFGAGRFEREVVASVEQAIGRQREPVTEIEEGLRAIQDERLRRAGRLYARQFVTYRVKSGADAECHACEVAFGTPQAPDRPALEIGPPESGLSLHGKIDRIDVIRREGRVLFRVIDYKTCSIPARREIDDGLALQLPLYALAVQRLVLRNVSAEPLDLGYWGLRKEGYKPGKTFAVEGISAGSKRDVDWQSFIAALERYVLDLLERLRAGEFPVAPRKEGCTRSCDYHAVCRITQIRQADKHWRDAPRLGRS